MTAVQVGGRTRPPGLQRPSNAFDLLRVPGIGALLRWRWGRLVFQIPLLLLAGLMIYDGLTGPQLAPQNVATVSAWVHYRGLVVLALLVAGNLFCMSCPFTLPRTLARRLSNHGRRWPRALRSKWLAILLLVAMVWLYEWLDLWASPWLTAWVAVGYFLGAFVLEAIFTESPFCKYLCPLGSFNFVGSTISPLQVTARDVDVCKSCAGKECVNGNKHAPGESWVLGCGTDLYVPQIGSNMDCVLCLDCARACPYDNVALAARRPLFELTANPWPRRWDVAMLLLVFAFAGLTNAFGMVPPVYELQARLAQWLNIANEAVILLLIFGVGNLVVPVALGVGAAWLSRRLSRVRSNGRAAESSWNAAEPLRVVFARYAPAVVPLGFAIWFAHYGFHFATGALTIVPVLQNFLLDHGVTLLGTAPNWALGPILPAEWLTPLEVAIVLLGFAGSLIVTTRLANQANTEPQMARLAAVPWLILLLGLALAALAVFAQPMEMRGSAGFLG